MIYHGLLRAQHKIYHPECLCLLEVPWGSENERAPKSPLLFKTIGMKSTARILYITGKYGEDQKPQLASELKALRREIKAELLRHINAGITKAKNEYSNDIKPGRKFSSINQSGKSPSDGDQFG